MLSSRAARTVRAPCWRAVGRPARGSRPGAPTPRAGPRRRPPVCRCGGRGRHKWYAPAGRAAPPPVPFNACRALRRPPAPPPPVASARAAPRRLAPRLLRVLAAPAPARVGPGASRPCLRLRRFASAQSPPPAKCRPRARGRLRAGGRRAPPARAPPLHSVPRRGSLGSSTHGARRARASARLLSAGGPRGGFGAAVRGGSAAAGTWGFSPSRPPPGEA